MIDKRGSFVRDRENSELYFLWNGAVAIALNIYCHIVKLLRRREHRRSPRYGVCICAIFKDEAHNFDEWVSYHIHIGVDHIYLYNNFSTDNYRDILAPYIASGHITLVDWPHIRGQIAAYQHCYESHRDDCRWLGFIDLDEFVVPNTTASISEFLDGYKEYPSLLIFWRMFGCSGHMEHNGDRLTIEQYEMAWGDNYEVGKLFYNLSFPIAKIALHYGSSYATLLGRRVKIYPVNDSKRFVNPYYISFGAKSDRDIQINHYWSKSYSDYSAKRNKGRATSRTNFITDERLLKFEHLNSAPDHRIKRFIIGTKMEMRRRGDK